MQYLTLNYPILGAAHSVIKVRIKFVSEHFKLMMLMKDPFEIDFFRCKKLENIFPILNQVYFQNKKRENIDLNTENIENTILHCYIQCYIGELENFINSEIREMNLNYLQLYSKVKCGIKPIFFFITNVSSVTSKCVNMMCVYLFSLRDFFWSCVK